MNATHRKLKPLKWYRVSESGEHYYMLVRGSPAAGLTLTVPLRYYPGISGTDKSVVYSERTYFRIEDMEHIKEVPDKLVNELWLKVLRNRR